MAEEEDRRRKQEYLRKEIVENDYDAGAFTVFCEEQRSADIDYWTYEELVDLVNEFKHIQQFLPKPKPKSEEKKSPKLVEASRSKFVTVPALKAIDNELSLAQNIEVVIEE